MRLLSWLAILLPLGVAGCNPQADAKFEPAPPEAEIQAALNAVTAQMKLKKREACSLASKSDQYETLSKAGRFREAADAIRPCAVAVDDKDVTAMLKRAETEGSVKAVNDNRLNAQARLDALDYLAQNAPDRAVPFAAKRKSIEAMVARDGKARRKLQGASVGMSVDEVLASSWGRPDSVNKTTTANRTSEQWVYGGGNYLYFDQGRLTAIQH